MGRVGKLNTTLSYGSRWKTQHNAFLSSPYPQISERIRFLNETSPK
ncbi:hypothetical protein LEP1GSC096_1961 [Leptospira interrogans serovar Hebdomadis str. R499]|nr:hypothetical protein LEP1GSC096_1961 [Leptospira interrogans serovar Hebdomadis str. R499]